MFGPVGGIVQTLTRGVDFGAAARAVLAAPLFGRVHLAGEATAPNGWYSTAGGAWLAGRSAIAAIDRDRGLA